MAFLVMALAPAAGAQRLDPGEPASVASTFLRGLQRLEWEAVATAVHPETAAVFREHMAAMLSHDASGSTGRRALGGAAPSEVVRWSDDRFLAQLLAALHQEVPMLLGVLATNTYDILGTVPEGPQRTHVLVRTTAFTNGSTSSKVEVLTLESQAGRWSVRDAPALDALLVALATFTMG